MAKGKGDHQSWWASVSSRFFAFVASLLRRYLVGVVLEDGRAGAWGSESIYSCGHSSDDGALDLNGACRACHVRPRLLFETMRVPAGVQALTQMPRPYVAGVWMGDLPAPEPDDDSLFAIDVGFSVRSFECEIVSAGGLVAWIDDAGDDGAYGRELDYALAVEIATALDCALRYQTLCSRTDQRDRIDSAMIRILRAQRILAAMDDELREAILQDDLTAEVAVA